MSDKSPVNTDPDQQVAPLQPRPESPLPETAKNPFSVPAGAPGTGAGTGPEKDNRTDK